MSKYLPSLQKVSQEVISTAVALIVVAWIISKSPYLKALVKNYQDPTTL